MANESITNLSWLLEQVAKQLEELAKGVRAEEKLGTTFESSSKAVQEAILHALAASGGDKELDIKQAIQLLKARRDDETK